MLSLPKTELVLLGAVITFYAIAAFVGILQLAMKGARFRTGLFFLFTLGTTLLVVMLIIRAAAIKGIPLTGLFESMLTLTLMFGLIYLVLGQAVEQVWFSSAMAWMILVMTLLAALVAEPAGRPMAAAAQPWAIVHGLAMICGATMVVLAATAGVLYLLANRRLKRKQLDKVFGKFPSIQKLERYNVFGLRAAFVLVTIGMVGGIGGAVIAEESLNRSVVDLLWDGKTLGIGIVWLLLGLILGARRMRILRERYTAWVSIVALVFVLFAFVGSAVWCRSAHDFSVKQPPASAKTEVHAP